MAQSENKSYAQVAGLDKILHGGLVPSRIYLVSGGPGFGKTTPVLHSLIARAGENRPLTWLRGILSSMPEQLPEGSGKPQK